MDERRGAWSWAVAFFVVDGGSLCSRRIVGEEDGGAGWGRYACAAFNGGDLLDISGPSLAHTNVPSDR